MVRHRPPPLVALLGALALLASFCGIAAAQERFTADAIKAAYLYRIAGYVTWPGTEPPTAPFTIAVLGNAAVADDLRRLLPAHAINGRSAQVRVIASIGDLRAEQMLYIGEGFSGDLRAAISSISNRPILVITDDEQGLADGSTINFVEINRHVRLEVSLTAAARAGLGISSQLLSVAARVEGRHLRSGTECARTGLRYGPEPACRRTVVARRPPITAGAEL